MSQDASGDFYFQHKGHCPACDKDVTFQADGPQFRGTLKCSACKSVPRTRAFMHVIETMFANWRDLTIHEGSPGWDMVSQRLVRDCKSYTASQFVLGAQSGTVQTTRMPCKTLQVEDLERQTFKDESFDLVLTQDVFEHVFRPDLAIREIARTLKPGGATVMTVPIVRRHRPSRRRARLNDGEVIHLEPPEYHANPVSSDGSLVTVDWGFDIVSYFQFHSGLSFMMLQIDNIDLGIRAELNEVLVGFKRDVPEL